MPADLMLTGQELVREASEANEREKNMSLIEAFRVYPKAMAWSVAITMSIVMDGQVHFFQDTLIFPRYDASVMGAFNAYPSFQEKFGIEAANGSMQIPPSWQNGISGANSVGVIFGLQVCRWSVKSRPRAD
jgi:SP family general alpha glucoside:H+ symporter-like MFS transporter